MLSFINWTPFSINLCTAFLLRHICSLRFPFGLVNHVYLGLTSHAVKTFTFKEELIKILLNAECNLEGDYTCISLTQSFFSSLPSKPTRGKVFASMKTFLGYPVLHWRRPPLVWKASFHLYLINGIFLWIIPLKPRWIYKHSFPLCWAI